MVILEPAPHAAFLLQGLGEFPHFLLWQAQPPDKGDGLATPTLGFTVQPHYTIAGSGGLVLAADALGDRAVALWAESPRFCRVNQPVVFSLVHVLIRVFEVRRQYISVLTAGTVTVRGGPGLTNIDELAQQLVDVQTQLAYHEDLVGGLNSALATQQQEILLLRRQLQLLKQRQDEQGPGPGATGPDEDAPPHY